MRDATHLLAGFVIHPGSYTGPCRPHAVALALLVLVWAGQAFYLVQNAGATVPPDKAPPSSFRADLCPVCLWVTGLTSLT